MGEKKGAGVDGVRVGVTTAVLAGEVQSDDFWSGSKGIFLSGREG